MDLERSLLSVPSTPRPSASHAFSRAPWPTTSTSSSSPSPPPPSFDLGKYTSDVVLSDADLHKFAAGAVRAPMPLFLAAATTTSASSPVSFNSGLRKYVGGQALLILGGATATYYYFPFPPMQSTLVTLS